MNLNRAVGDAPRDSFAVGGERPGCRASLLGESKRFPKFRLALPGKNLSPSGDHLAGLAVRAEPDGKSAPRLALRQNLTGRDIDNAHARVAPGNEPLAVWRERPGLSQMRSEERRVGKEERV